LRLGRRRCGERLQTEEDYETHEPAYLAMSWAGEIVCHGIPRDMASLVIWNGAAAAPGRADRDHGFGPE
jgi:hypothetical protein